ncbi:MAG: hypothetical protein NWF07_13805 [Candidatus Bathyarchaeota archaeon]|nr:hypothetical protein [Candidatus Bathyarchaeota archaeon]
MKMKIGRWWIVRPVGSTYRVLKEDLRDQHGWWKRFRIGKLTATVKAMAFGFMVLSEVCGMGDEDVAPLIDTFMMKEVV